MIAVLRRARTCLPGFRPPNRGDLARLQGIPVRAIKRRGPEAHRIEASSGRGRSGGRSDGKTSGGAERAHALSRLAPESRWPSRASTGHHPRAGPKGRDSDEWALRNTDPNDRPTACTDKPPQTRCDEGRQHPLAGVVFTEAGGGSGGPRWLDGDFMRRVGRVDTLIAMRGVHPCRVGGAGRRSRAGPLESANPTERRGRPLGRDRVHDLRCLPRDHAGRGDAASDPGRLRRPGRPTSRRQRSQRPRSELEVSERTSAGRTYRARAAADLCRVVRASRSAGTPRDAASVAWPARRL